jgi:hypothetical protein
MAKALRSCSHSHRVLSANPVQAHSLLRKGGRFLPGSLPSCSMCGPRSAAIFFIILTWPDEYSMNADYRPPQQFCAGFLYSPNRITIQQHNILGRWFGGWVVG